MFGRCWVLPERSHSGTIVLVAPAAQFPAAMVRRWPDRDVGPFALRVCVGIMDGVLSIIGIELYADRARPRSLGSSRRSTGSIDFSEPDFPDFLLDDVPDVPHRIDAKVLRDLAPGKLLSEWKALHRQQLDSFLAEYGTASAASDLGRLLLASVERSETKRHRVPRPEQRADRGLGRLHWQAVAEVYRDALERGDAPTSAVAHKFNVSKSAAAKWVAKCRALWLLPPTSQGRSSVKGAKTS